MHQEGQNGEETDEKFWLLRSFVVFNADQVTGAPAEKYQVQEGDTDNSQVVVPSYEEADQLIENTGANIRYGGDQAFYQPKATLSSCHTNTILPLRTTIRPCSMSLLTGANQD